MLRAGLGVSRYPGHHPRIYPPLPHAHSHSWRADSGGGGDDSAGRGNFAPNMVSASSSESVYENAPASDTAPPAPEKAPSVDRAERTAAGDGRRTGRAGGGASTSMGAEGPPGAAESCSLSDAVKLDSLSIRRTKMSSTVQLAS